MSSFLGLIVLVEGSNWFHSQSFTHMNAKADQKKWPEPFNNRNLLSAKRIILDI